MVQSLRRRNSCQGQHFMMLVTVFMLSMFVVAASAGAAEGVIYKEPRPMKKALEKKKGEGSGEEKEEYFYDPRGKTDPFESFIAKMEAMEEKKKGKPKTYLETLDLSQLELIAIIVGPKGNWAMVREAKGTGHVIRPGTPIGTRGGVVHKITEKEVIIKERYRDFRGQERERFVTKKLPSLE